MTQFSLIPPYPQFVGEPGKRYAIVAGVIRNPSAGTGWALVDGDGSHSALNVDSVSNDASYVTINYASIGAKRVVSFLVAPDEVYAKQGIFCGASVALNAATIQLAKNLSVSGYVYYDTATSSWKYSSAYGITGVAWNSGAGAVEVTHLDFTGLGSTPTANVRDGGLIAALGSTTNTMAQIKFFDYAGALVTAQQAAMKLYFGRQGQNYMNPNNVKDDFGNLWFIGVFEV